MRTQPAPRGNAIPLICIVAALLVAPRVAAVAVGRTDASYGVTANGAALYSIPIRVTEGISGMTPSLAISYAGPGSRSIIGAGFKLSGLSYITPCRKTIVEDLIASPILLFSTDRYCLDGMRLRAVSGTYGADNTIYRTEIDQMVRVTSYGATNGIPGWFKVEMPNGLEYEYGNSTNSKLLASGAVGAPPQFWAVSKITDTSNNSIVFQYDKDDSLRRFRPNYISYTERGGAGHYRVTFIYQSTAQPEPTLSFTPSAIGGAAKSDDKLLERIELSHDLTVYRKYLLTYQAGAGTSQRLNTVQECVPGFPDECFPATQLTWQNATAGHNSAAPSSAVASGVMPLDVNGDGIEDLVWSASGTWRYMLGSASGFGSPVNTGVAVTNAGKAMPLEWNGDGFADLLIDWSDGKWRVLTGSASGLSTSPVQAGPSPGIPSNLSNTTWTVADANSDGRDDLLSMGLQSMVAIMLRLNSATGFGSASQVYGDLELKALSQGFINPLGKSAVVRPDFNGDGRIDLVVYGCIWEAEPPAHCIVTGWFQLLSNDTTYTNEGMMPYASFMIDLRYADFNADGLTDVAYPAQTPSTWYIGFGQGSGGLAIDAGPSFSGYTNYQTLTGDYDGDGYDDLYAEHTSSAQWHVLRGSGTGLASTYLSTNISTVGTGWMLRDQSGDSLPDLGRYDSGSLVWSSFGHLGLAGNRLVAATDGLGNAVSFTYLPMTDSAVYTKGSGAVFPDRDVRFGLPLVRTMQVAPAGGIAFTLTYSYSSFKVNVQGRPPLGMASRTTSDSRNSIITTETFRQDSPYIGALANITVRQSTSGPIIQDVTHTYNHHVLDSTAGNERYLPYRSQTVTKTYEVNPGGSKDGLQVTEDTESRTVNTFGNATFVSITTTDKDSGSTEFGFNWKTEITSTFKQDTTSWCIAPQTSRSEKRILPDLSSETRATTWVVDSTLCLATQETIEPGSGSTTSLITDIGHDACGNVNSITSYPAGQLSLARVTSFDYGARCQRPEVHTNPAGHQSRLEYEWSLALPTAHIDPNFFNDPTPKKTRFEYDGFGRLTREIRIDDTATRFVQTACDAGNSWCGKNSGARFKVTQTARDTSNLILRTDEQFLDGFGRVRWTHNDSLESGPAIVETLFDSFGLPAQQTQPYFSGGIVYSTTFTRDLLGRIKQINAPINESTISGRITGFSYEGRDVKVTDPKNNVTTRRGNAIGQLRAIVDPSPGGTTTYAYKPFGEIASITDAATPTGNPTTWSYNLRGLVIGTVDPDSGSSTFEVNAFGETTKIRDAKTSSQNWTTEFTFDALGRPKKRIESEGETNWNWGEVAADKNIGRLESITSPGSYVEEYDYDSIGRLSQQKVTADGANYFINLSYVLATGQLSTLEYPTSTSGYRLKLAYDYASNLVKRVRDANSSTTFWEAASTDAFGHVQLENFGNGVQTFTDFDQASGMMAAREGGVGGGTGLIHSQVAWDLNGNLIQRKDLKLSPSVIEDFYYDALNRLDHSERNGATNLNMAFNAIGNITSKSGVGSYDYTTAQAGCTYYTHTQPRAVRNAGGTVYCYDANGNMVKRAGSTISYTSYNLPSVINSGSNSSTLSYGAWRNRYKQVAVNSGATETTIYLARLLEKVTRGSLVEYRHLIAGSNGTAAIHTRRTGGSPASDTIYVHTDHLGSPELFTNASGGVLVRPSFTAYGARRDGTDWAGGPSAGDLTAIGNATRRGFTGHEHLDAVALIHMNGRVYDPVVGRFLGADPVLSLGNSQAVNTYTYVWNGPLTLVDPLGLHICAGDRGRGGDNSQLATGGEGGAPFAFREIETCNSHINPPRRQPPFRRDQSRPPPTHPDGGGGTGNGQREVENKNGCMPPAVDRSMEAEAGDLPHFIVFTYLGYNLSESYLDATFDAWRYGSAWAPGGSPNTPDETAYLLDGAGSEYYNWVYVTTDRENRTFTNWTLPGHIFRGQVQNFVYTNSGFSFLVSMGIGGAQNIGLNAAAGPEIFKYLQETVVEGVPPVQIGNQCGRAATL